MVEQQEQQLLTTAGVAKLLGYSVDSVRRLCEAGKFPNAQRVTHSSQWRIPLSDVAALRESSKPKVRVRRV